MANDDILTIKNVKDFDPAQTFECGQCFRWKREPDDAYTGVVGAAAYNVSVKEKTWENELKKNVACETKLKDNSGYDVTVKCVAGDPDFDIWEDYFDLDTDYGEIKRFLTEKNPSDLKLRAAIESGSGIRILKQDPWETILSFVISQNNNIPRISGCIEKLSRRFGERLSGEGEYYSIPSCETISRLSKSDLSEIKLGYRDEFIISAATAVSEYVKAGRDLRSLSYEELLDIKGIGPKVASCIRLFACHDVEAFPIDTWVKKVMNCLYGFSESDVRGMKKYAEEHFGPYGGIAQQYLFNYMRNTIK